MTESGGSIHPYQPKGDEVLANLSEGSCYPADRKQLLDELQNESRREPENPDIGLLLQVLSSRAGTYDAGGVLPAGSSLGTAMEHAQRGLDWIRDHYRDGTFRCPSEDGGAQ